MSKQVNQYRFFCGTEGKYVYAWGDVAPTKCPNDTQTLAGEIVTIVDSVNSNAVSIIQETGQTNGHYCCRTFALPVDAGATGSMDIQRWKNRIEQPVCADVLRTRCEMDSTTVVW